MSDPLDGLRFMCKCGHHLQSHESRGVTDWCIVIGCGCKEFVPKEEA